MVRGGMVVDVTPDHVQRTSPKSKMRVVGPEEGMERSSGDGKCEDVMVSVGCDREGEESRRDAERGTLACSERVLSAPLETLYPSDGRFKCDTPMKPIRRSFLPTHLCRIWYVKLMPLCLAKSSRK